MGFFSDNPIIEFCHILFKRPGDVLMWLFTGIVVSSSLYLILAPFPDGMDNSKDHDNRKKGRKRL